MNGGLLSMEYVHHVTDGDAVLGKVPRDECLEKALIHRAVAVLVFNPAQDIFVHKRSIHKELYPALWDGSVGGAVRWGESYEGAAKRELQEELGLSTILVYKTSYKYRSDTLNYNGRLFTCTAVDQPVVQSLEIEEWKWHSVEDLAVELQINPGNFIPDFLVAWASYSSLEKHF